MELTVEALRDVRFREGWRGYVTSEVDDFIDQVSAGTQKLHDQIRELTTRLERAESRTVGENDETVKRTLVLAQRAADLVVSEAKSVAERIVADARRDAERIVADAKKEGDVLRQQLTSEVERDVAERRAAADAEHRSHYAGLVAEREALELERTARLAELDELRTHAVTARDRLRAALTDHLVRLDKLGEELRPAAALPDAAAAPSAPHAGDAAGAPVAGGESPDAASAELAPGFMS